MNMFEPYNKFLKSILKIRDRECLCKLSLSFLEEEVQAHQKNLKYIIKVYHNMLVTCQVFANIIGQFPTCIIY